MTDPEGRPDPEALVRRAHAKEGREKRARLRVFFGFAPGVGKTHRMLQVARERAAEPRYDVVAGFVETHGRAETEALLEGLDVLPRRKVEHRGRLVEELDLDAALARRPGLLLLDDLAHTNAPGSRHAKRWQDTIELLDAGIDVFTTVNVQHVESLNDVVSQITGVHVRETIPDSILDRADEIELVDIAPEELLARLREGKVHLPEQAKRAAAHFFRRGNLLALRELALRRTAERVDVDVRQYREQHGVVTPWPAGERILDAFCRQAAFAFERVRLANEANSAALRAKTEAMRSSLLSAVSHDLRTPLSAITGAATALRDDRGLGAQTRVELLESICEEAERLERLVANLLDMTRLDSVPVALKRAWVPLEELVGSALTRLERKLGERPVHVAFSETLPLLSVDPVFFEQVFINLFENAARYTSPGSPIEVLARSEPGVVIVEVADSGPGLPAGSEARVFEKFYRGGHAGEVGAGLGLSICKAIVEAHGGTISAENRAEGGAMFRILVPIPGVAPSVLSSVEEATS